MNAIRATLALNARELEAATPPSASWHADYRDTAWIYIGGLPLQLSEGDVLTVFSQYGTPTHIHLARDKETGKSRGFGWVKYEDQRSCDLAVDNLGGADVLGRKVRVDHARYRVGEGEDVEGYRVDGERDGAQGEQRRERIILKEEKELEELLRITAGKWKGEEEEDPMREYLIREKREEVERARKRAEKDERRERRHHRRHRREKEEEEDRDGDGDGNRSDGDRRRHRHHHRRRRGDEDGGNESRREQRHDSGSNRSRSRSRDRDRRRNMRQERSRERRRHDRDYRD